MPDINNCDVCKYKEGAYITPADAYNGGRAYAYDVRFTCSLYEAPMYMLPMPITSCKGFKQRGEK